MQWDWEKCNKSVQSVESVQRVKSVQGIEKLDEHIETFTKLKIRDRAIRCEDVYQNMSNRNCILLKDLIGRRKLEELDKMEWVVIAVLQSKLPPKATKNGDSYSIWNITDLNDNSISVFMFAQAHQGHWKQRPGSIMAFVNPGIIPASEKGKFALKVSDDESAVLLGISVDFGICKANTASGARCKFAVNINRCAYCIMHIAKQYGKSGSGRANINTNGHFSKFTFVKGDTGNHASEGNYGMKGRSQLVHKRKQSDNLGIHESLSASGVVLTRPAPLAKKKGKFLDPNQLQNHIRNSRGKQTNSNTPLTSRDKIIASALGVKAQHKKMDHGLHTVAAKKPNSTETSSTNNFIRQRDVLGELINTSNPRKVDTSLKKNTKYEPVAIPQQSNIYGNLERQTMMQHRTVVTTQDPEHTQVDNKQMGQQHKMAARKIKLLGGMENSKLLSRKSLSAKLGIRTTTKLSQKAPKQDFMTVFKRHSVDVHSAAGQKLMNTSSSHADVLLEDQANAIDKKLGSLEGCEYMAEKAQQVTKIKISAFHCKTCSYIKEIPVSTCGEKGHDVLPVQTIKRFFACLHCSNRCALLNAKIPTAPCMKCDNLNWKRTSMHKEKRGPETRSKFLPTGGNSINSLRFS